jgi:hypothetical protein
MWEPAVPISSTRMLAFEHVLRYLCSRVLPVFYDNAKGDGQALYLVVLEEAKYFQILRLEN